MMRGEIEENNQSKYNKKQIKIKRMRIKLKKKIQIKYTFIVQQGEDRKKKDEKKTVYRCSTTTPPCTCETPMERGWQGISNATLVGGVWRRSDVAQAAHLLACTLHT